MLAYFGSVFWDLDFGGKSTYVVLLLKYSYSTQHILVSLIEFNYIYKIK